MSSTLFLAPLFRSSIGFDRFSDLFETAMRSETGASYPPYNVEKHGEDRYRIVIAAAGLQESDLELQIERDMLTIAGNRREKSNEKMEYLHQGIAQRAFKLSFRLADHIQVEGASLKHGLLHVDLKREVPEAAKPRRISISREGFDKPYANTVLLDKQAA